MTLNKLDQFAHNEIINSLIAALNEHYIFADIAKEIEKDLSLSLAQKKYENIKYPEDFSRRVTDDLQRISEDKHLRLCYTRQEKSIHLGLNMKEQMEARLLEAKVNSYGFHRVERLQGNIGYIDLRIFFDPMFAGETAVSTMNLVSTTDALIIDLRKNKGGSPFMVAFIISHLYDSEPFHLNTFYSRSDESASQTWTSPYVPGKRYTDKPIYILTSSETFSAAEEFTYNLKNLKRAIVIGEVTKGGANPGAVHQLTSHFNVFIPHGQVINPITGTNWEGKGVSPDIVTNSKEAYDIAYEHALNYVIDHYKDNAQYNFLLGEAREQLRHLKK